MKMENKDVQLPDFSATIKKSIKNQSSKKVKKEEIKNLFKFIPYLQIWILIFSLHQEGKCIPFLQMVICEVRMDRVF